MDEVTSESGITISKADIAEVREVYQKCWDEYYDWEPGYCTSKLRSLEPGNEVSSSKSLLDKLGWAAWDCGLQEWDTEESAASEPFATKTIKIQNEITSEVTEHQIPCYKISVSNFPPVPVYEFCTRLTKCLSSSLDNEEYRHTGNYDEATGQPKMGYTLWIYFCPFVDIDESFPEASRQSFLEASVLSWEDMRNVDNDVQVIMMETVLRLHERQFPIELLDETSILPESIFPSDNDIDTCLLQTWKYRSSNRPPHWKNGPNIVLPIDREENLDDMLKSWCPICMQHECTPHLSGSVSFKHASQVTPLPKSVHMPTEECDEDCILLNPNGEGFIWDPEDFDILRKYLVTGTLLEWTIPCEIAAILGKPCWETYAQMTTILQEATLDAGNDDSSSPTVDKRRRKALQTAKPNKEDYMPHNPCVHPGECFDCDCALKGGYCHQSCKCPTSCNRRPPGCECSGNCYAQPQTCRCSKAGRECSPSLCLNCKPLSPSSTCRNNQVQKQHTFKTVVKRAQYGWGLFAMEKIPRDSIIAPYTGEYYREDTASNRELVAKYLQRNYNYELNKQLHIDGTRSGNETRFINDPRNPSKANCRPDFVWVGGDLHLTIRTSKDIFPGDEILLSYGENYWSTDLERRSLNDSKRRRSFGAGDKIRRKKSQEGKHMK